MFAALLASLSTVIWRQSRALDVLRHLDRLRAERAMQEAQKADLQHRIQRLESRARVVAEARQKLGMHVPDGDEIVILPLVPWTPPVGKPGSLARGGEGLSSSGAGGEAEPGGAGAPRAKRSAGGRT